MSIKSVIDKVNRRIDKQIRVSTIELFSSVVKMTPVDTGRARGNWIPSIINPVTQERDKKAPVGTTVINEIISVVPSKAGSVVWLTNNVPYIRVLEYGRENGKPGSKQAPQGMVRISCQRFGRMFAEATQERLSDMS